MVLFCSRGVVIANQARILLPIGGTELLFVAMLTALPVTLWLRMWLRMLRWGRMHEAYEIIPSTITKPRLDNKVIDMIAHS